MPATPPPTDLRQLAIDAMRDRGLRPAFPQEALDQAEAARRVTPQAGGAVLDQRALPWFSIDNDDTKDLDQLSCAQSLPDGGTRLLVAIADVDVLVSPGSAPDEHAAANTTSVYTAAGVFAMLPEVLSTDLSSLHEGEDRWTVVVEMDIRADGDVFDSRIYRAVVRNRAKLTYNQVSAWLEGDSGPLPQFAGFAELEDQLRLHDDVATRLGQWRHRRGALNVKTVSARPVFEGDRLVDLRPDERNRAKDLIADLMIAANATTARFLRQGGFPSLRRVLDVPRRWDRIVKVAGTHGFTLPATPDAVALDRFLCERREADPEGFADLSLSIIKMLGPGEYAAAEPGAESPGHFGLAVADYAHSTAPNRRYTDLVTQRQLKAALEGAPPPYSVESLTAIARHCTLQEDNANKVERQVLKAAAAYLLQDRVGDTFDALVTGAAAKGTFVRITSPMVEGRLVRGFEGADVGDTLRVRLVALDPVAGHIDFERAV